MNTRTIRRAAGDPATAEPAAEDLRATPQVPAAIAPKSKLALAMEKVSDGVTHIQKMGADIAELERVGASNTVFQVSTKEGYRVADDVRKRARKLRLDIKDLRAQGTKLLNDLKTEFWAAADPQMERLQAIEDNAKGQIDAEDRKEAERKQRHADNIAAIERLAKDNLAACRSPELERRIAALGAIVVDDSYEEFQARAMQAAEDTGKTLRFALAAAQRREQEERELAERRAREEKQERLRAKIRSIRDTPAGCEGTDLENVEAVLRGLTAAPPTGEEFGDLLEFAELAHEKACNDLRAMADALRAAEVERQAALTREEEAAIDRMIADEVKDDGTPLNPDARRSIADDDGPEALVGDDDVDGLAMFAEPPPAAEVNREHSTRMHALPTAPRAVGTAVDMEKTRERFADPDPFSTPIPAPAAPAARRRVVAPAPAAAATPEPIPDLLASAQLVVAAFDRLPRNVTVEWTMTDDHYPDAACLTFTRAIKYLRDALALLDEFPA